MFLKLYAKFCSLESKYNNTKFVTKIKSDLSVRFDIEIKSDPEIGLETKPNLTLKLGYILKINMVLELGFGVKFVCIQNFELILNILEHSKPSISSLKQPGRLAACLLEKTPLTEWIILTRHTLQITCNKHDSRMVRFLWTCLLNK